MLQTIPGDIPKDDPSAARALLRDFVSVAGRKAVPAAVYVMAGAVFEGLSVSLLVPLLGLIFGMRALPGGLGRAAAALFGTFGADTPLLKLLLLMGVFGVLMIVRAFVIAARDIAIVELQVRFIEAQRLRLARNLVAAKWEYVARLRHSRIAHLMSGDIQRLGIGIQFLLQTCVAATLLLAQWTLAFILAPGLATVLLLLLVVGAVVFGPMLRRARSLGNYVTEANLSLLNSTTQFLGGLKLAISQNLEDGFVEEAGQTLHQLANRQIGYARQHVRSQAALVSLTALVGGASVLVGFGWFHVAPPVLITLLLIVTRVMAPVGQIQQGAQQFSQVLGVYEKVRQLQGELVAAARGEGVRRGATPVPAGAIVFEHVSFHHRDEHAQESQGGLDSLDLTIAPGEFLGITGASGTGKTTFADLLVGLYPPQTGRIVVGGATLEGPLLAAWRDALSYVSQDPFLFHDTIRRNLAWANARAGEDAMWQALSVAGAAEMVRRMEHGLETVVGERGTLVSGGERQRIALARALLRQPRLLVLDEATGAIDSDGERDIFARLRAMPSPPTIVLIAHRTENLVACDRVLRFGRRDAHG